MPRGSTHHLSHHFAVPAAERVLVTVPRVLRRPDMRSLKGVRVRIRTFASTGIVAGSIGWVVLASSGCAATLEPRVAYRASTSGSYDRALDESPGHYQVRLSPDARTAEESHVAVYFETLPQGVERQGQSIRVLPGFNHRVLGSARLYIDGALGISSMTSYAALADFADYANRWRRPYCYPQVILTWATVLLWSVLPPAWPCWGDTDISREKSVDLLTKIAVWAGGDAVIAGYFPHAEGISYDVPGTTVGFVLLLDPRVKEQHMMPRSAPGPEP